MESDTIHYPVYNYPDIFSKYFFGGKPGAKCPEHALVFVISGELTVRCACGSTTISEGGYIFLRKDKHTILERKSSEGKPFRSVFMGFNQCFLKKLHPIIDRQKISPDSGDFTDNVIELPKKPSLESLYISLLPYLQWESSPIAQLLEIKLMEAVYSLIQMDGRFYSCLFDFDTPAGEECGMAYPATQGVGDGCGYITQERDSSYITLHDDNRVTDVYLDVTYRNVARFFNAFGQGLIFPQIS